jgi:hypothetical protein
VVLLSPFWYNSNAKFDPDFVWRTLSSFGLVVTVIYRYGTKNKVRMGLDLSTADQPLLIPMRARVRHNWHVCTSIRILTYAVLVQVYLTDPTRKRWIKFLKKGKRKT